MGDACNASNGIPQTQQQQAFLESRQHAVALGDTPANEAERTAVVYRSAHDGQPQSDIHRVAEAERLHRYLALIVIHGQYCVEAPPLLRAEEAIGTEGAFKVQSFMP